MICVQLRLSTPVETPLGLKGVDHVTLDFTHFWTGRSWTKFVNLFNTAFVYSVLIEYISITISTAPSSDYQIAILGMSSSLTIAPMRGRVSSPDR